jgi:hypothetical protein
MIISPHISLAEYRCSHCGWIPDALAQAVSPLGFPIYYTDFFADFEAIRDRVGGPIPISSGCRCLRHDVAVQMAGGYTLDTLILGPHVFGLALDLACADDAAVDVLAAIVNAVRPELRMGICKGQNRHVHIDGLHRFPVRLLSQWQPGERWIE